MTGVSKILIVDDEKNIRRTLRMVLEAEGYAVVDAASAASAERVYSTEQPIDLVLLDVTLGQDNGLELLQRMKSREASDALACDPEVPVVMISGTATIDDAVRATRLGAFDFLEKPLERNRVLVTVRNAVEHRKMCSEVSQLRATVDSKYELLGNSIAMNQVKREIAKVAPTKTRVLITGESGTGKELIARAIHHNSNVRGGPFIKVNCAAIPPELIESELFGHERGAFTGAVAQKKGLFEVANDGSIFLDEIGDMSLPAQAKVLRVLQTGEMVRVGGETSLKTEARVVAATNRDLEQMVASGEFREDLFFRLNVVPIRSPSLRERADDIPLLAESFMRECCDDNGFGYKPITEVVLRKLQGYEWPGNIRELRNVMERLVIMSDDSITERDLPPYILDSSYEPKLPADSGANLALGAHTAKSLREFREYMESEFIRYRLDEFDWNISRTAQALGIERTNLHKKLRALGIHRDSRGDK